MVLSKLNLTIHVNTLLQQFFYFVLLCILESALFFSKLIYNLFYCTVTIAPFITTPLNHYTTTPLHHYTIIYFHLTQLYIAFTCTGKN